MSLQDRLTGDLREAMKKGDKPRQSALRMVRAGIKNAEIERQGALDDDGVLGIITKEVKQHRDSIAEFSKANRQDLVTKEEAELAILLEYLPEQLSREEIVAAARELIGDLGARGPGDKGKVMSRLMPQLKGRADGRLVGDVVSELLAGS